MLRRELEVARQLARRAGRAIEEIRLEGFSAKSKADETPVTEADLASDRIVREGLLKAFPSDGLLSEESTGHRGSSGRTWIVDPLDGTKGFINDVEGYAVQIGLVVDGQAIMGVVYEPKHERLYYAVRGQGAYMETGEKVVTPLRVSRAESFGEMTMVASSSLSSSLRDQLVTLLGLQEGIAMRSVGAKVGTIVRSVSDIYISSHAVHYWDSCGPLVICEEAGGRWTLVDGSPLSFCLEDELKPPAHAGPFVVSNGARHEEVCAAFARLIQT